MADDNRQASFDAWAACAPAPWRALWGKAKPGHGEVAHPLFAHVIDVAVVAEVIVRDHMAPAVRSVLADATGMDHATLSRVLPFWVAIHDLGKATPAFQGKVPELGPGLRAHGFDLAAPDCARAHGDAGAALLKTHLQEPPLSMKAGSAIRVGFAVAAHHGFFTNSAPALGPREAGESNTWSVARRELVDSLRGLFLGPSDDEDLRRLRLPESRGFDAILAGLTTVADWVGSMAEVFDYVRPDVEPADYLTRSRQVVSRALDRIGLAAVPTQQQRSFEDLFPFSPRPLQVAAVELAASLAGPSLVLIEAPMGEGKTEAALYLANAMSASAGQAGMFFALPTQATANQMLGRVRKFVSESVPEDARNLQLAHGEKTLVADYGRLIEAVYDEEKRRELGGVRAEAWFSQGKRTLLAPFAAGTVDQGLLGVLNTKHAFVRLYALAGKTVVIDEVHAYDTYTSVLLDRLLEWLRALGASVVLLSATLPSGRRRELLAKYGAGEDVDAPYPRISLRSTSGARATSFAVGRAAQRVLLEQVSENLTDVASRLGEELEAGGCVGWIVNTVNRAQEAYLQASSLRARGRIPEDTEIVLVHARLLGRDRQRCEDRIKAALGGDSATRPRRMLVIGTQVLEQSLDIDFDLMVTDLAPIDLVLQRTGRLHRHANRQRPERHAEPRLWLSRPAGEPLGFPLGVSQYVYGPLLLRRTAWVLHARSAIELPSDIEPLIEAVYTTPLPADVEARLEREFAETLAQENKDRSAAENAVFASPDEEGALYRQVQLEDPEATSKHAQMFAKTRLGRPSVSVVCLHRGPDGLYADPELKERAYPDLVRDHAQIRRLLEVSVKVSRRATYAALTATKPPEAWQANGLLEHRRLVVFEDGHATVDNQTLFLTTELGLVYDRIPEVMA